jgi:O-antigen ligase
LSGPRPTTAGILAAATAFLLPIAFNPAGHAIFWAPKASVATVAGFSGLPLLVGLARTRARRAALAGCAFLLLATVATVLAADPLPAVTGLYGWGTGLVFLFASVGLWAVGASTARQDQGVIVAGLLAGVGVSSCIGLLQALDLVNAASLEAASRASGLSGNATRLATLAAGVAALGVHRARTGLRWVWLVGVGAFIVQLTGTRSALGLVFFAAVIGAISIRHLKGLVLVAAVVIGTMLGTIVADVGGLATATARSTSGAAVIGGGPTTRVRAEVWEYAMDAFTRRPVTGHGPDRFLAATASDRSLEVARLEGSDVLYSDAHNIVVEHLVTVGALGTVTLLLFLGFGLAAANGPLVWFAGALLTMALVQPMEPGTTPLLFLTLGAAAAGAGGSTARLGRGAVLAGALAAVAAVSLLLGDVLLERGSNGDLAAAERADALLRPWPEPATVLARLHLNQRLRDGAGADPEDHATQSLEWRREAIRREPRSPGLYFLYGQNLEILGRRDEARAAYQRALQLDPWSVRTLRALISLSVEACDPDAAQKYADRALQVAPDDERLGRLVATGSDRC